MSKKVLKYSGALLALFGMSFSAMAQSSMESETRSAIGDVRMVQSPEEYKPHVAILAGVANPEGSFDAGADYGVDVGFQPIIPFGLGAEISQSNYTADDFKRTSFLVKGTYNLAGDIPVLKESYLGLAAGILVEDTVGGADSYGGLMPNLGFDIPTFQVNQRWVSLGANARYMITGSNAPDVFALNGVVKYWF